MAFSTVVSATLQGIRAELIHVEADVSNGLPVFHMVGYLSSEVKEAAERVKTAIRNCNIQIPPKKIVVNLAPATLRKRGAAFDLPVALAVLTSVGVFPAERLKGVMVVGELGLNGNVQKVSGILPMVRKAKSLGYHTCLIPKQNVSEGALVSGVEILGAESLEQVCRYLKGECEILPWTCSDGESSGNPLESVLLDYSDIKGQEVVKRAVEVAVSGGHNLLFVGPPGSGKSMAAKRIPTILPTPSMEESLEITEVYSIVGKIDENRPLITGRPFRSVHHTTTKAALVGGGGVPVPGEISLAHGGVLFLDELAEFQKNVLEVLRQPLEEHKIHLARSQGNYVFPADFMLVAAMNPCPCGNYPDHTKCICTPGQIRQYLGRVSQPFLDRMDICVEAPRIPYEHLKGEQAQETSAQIRKRVCHVREIQRERYQGTEIVTNARLGVKELNAYCCLGPEEETLMKQAFTTLGLTARTYHKILRVARTIADMEQSEAIQKSHLKEAIGYRTLDKKYWGR